MIAECLSSHFFIASTIIIKVLKEKDFPHEMRQILLRRKLVQKDSFLYHTVLQCVHEEGAN
jgi:hypothetical protein